VLKSFPVLLAAVAAIGAGFVHAHPGSSDVTVHEWGTFTSIAGEDGRAASWLPLDGPADLPCFVERTYPVSPKGAMFARVRMETPVLYFYASRETTVDVRVGFSQGLFTEYFPSAAVKPASISPANLIEPGFVGAIKWSGVRILPRGSTEFPLGNEPSHYYEARATDASPIVVGADTERFLFYRGVGNFALPVTARVMRDDATVVGTIGSDAIPALMRFENRGGRIGYGVQDAPASEVRLPRPVLNSDFHATKAALENMLETQGLYPREARAMIETWRDSWFTEGSRIFYIVPARTVDAILPLRINPTPERIVRVFVGRVELATDATLTDLRSGLLGGDSEVLEKYGRFLTVFGERLLARTADSSDASRIRARLEGFAPAIGGPAPACR
jgi:hypothetical protein